MRAPTGASSFQLVDRVKAPVVVDPARPPVRCIAAGIGFTEGPIWTVDNRVLVTSMSRGILYEVFLDGRPPIPFAETGGGPNGLAADGDGSVWVAQNGGTLTPTRSSRPARPSLQRWSAGELMEAAGDGFVAPNDVVVGSDGRIWFTDPAGTPEPDDNRLGRLCAYDPATGSVETLLADSPYPNGLAFGVDPDDFFLAETRPRRILAFRRTSDGLTRRQVFAELDHGRPDGFAIDAHGRLHVAATSAHHVAVFDHRGVRVETIDLGESFPTNCCFAGEDLNILLITAAKGGRVLALERTVPGNPVPQSSGGHVP